MTIYPEDMSGNDYKELTRMERLYAPKELKLYQVLDAFPSECRKFVNKYRPQLKAYQYIYQELKYISDYSARLIIEALVKSNMGKRKVKQLNNVALLIKLMNPDNKTNLLSVDISLCKTYPIENLYDFKRKRKHQNGFMASCPFGTHEDNHPSFGVKHNNFICFSCGKHGDSIQFQMDISGMDFVSAVKYIRNLQHTT